ncbi:hypothetical protein BC834DRAFT_909464 [Gloeopeniophorella convolvens]|nr:hypothetical protein BC834DRAFT_909464 [Gloeopeniophorella convolvens]
MTLLEWLICRSKCFVSLCVILASDSARTQPSSQERSLPYTWESQYWSRNPSRRAGPSMRLRVVNPLDHIRMIVPRNLQLWSQLQRGMTLPRHLWPLALCVVPRTRWGG